jgi:hypothetical protein
LPKKLPAACPYNGIALIGMMKQKRRRRIALWSFVPEAAPANWEHFTQDFICFMA